jgi:hypothetical protein
MFSEDSDKIAIVQAHVFRCKSQNYGFSIKLSVSLTNQEEFSAMTGNED